VRRDHYNDDCDDDTDYDMKCLKDMASTTFSPTFHPTIVSDDWDGMNVTVAIGCALVALVALVSAAIIAHAETERNQKRLQSYSRKIVVKDSMVISDETTSLLPRADVERVKSKSGSGGDGTRMKELATAEAVPYHDRNSPALACKSPEALEEDMPEPL
jgi:hypothetical protein